MLNRMLLAFAAACAVPACTMAADLPVRTAVSVQSAAPAWSGFYGGLNVGFAYNHLTVTDRDYYDGLGDSSAHTYGVIGGAQAGYGWQAGSLVYGLETDIQALSNRRSDDNVYCCNSANVVDYPSAKITSRPDVLGTIRGRVGLALDPALIYVTGGFAYGHGKDSYQDVFSTHQYDNGSDYKWSSGGWKPGFTAGAGVEWQTNPNWSWKVEGLYYQLAEKTVSFQNPNSVDREVFRQSFSNEGVIMRVGTNYRW